MRSLRTILLSILLLQASITFIVIVTMLVLSRESNSAIQDTRQQNVLASRARDVASKMLLARKYEKEYLFTLGSRNMNASTSQAAQEWRTVYKQLGEALNQLQPLMQTPAEQEQFADWSKS